MQAATGAHRPRCEGGLGSLHPGPLAIEVWEPRSSRGSAYKHPAEGARRTPAVNASFMSKAWACLEPSAGFCGVPA